MASKNGDNPIIENGEHFCIVRGFELGRRSLVCTSSIFGDASDDGPPQYDRSYEGIVWLALEVCGPLIAGMVVHSQKSYLPVGHRASINTREVEVWPVTKAFVDQLAVNVAACGPVRPNAGEGRQG